MGTQGRTGLRRLIIGSVAEATLRRAVTPVLVGPSEDAEAPAAGPTPAEQLLVVLRRRGSDVTSADATSFERIFASSGSWSNALR